MRGSTASSGRHARRASTSGKTRTCCSRMSFENVIVTAWMCSSVLPAACIRVVVVGSALSSTPRGLYLNLKAEGKAGWGVCGTVVCHGEREAHLCNSAPGRARRDIQHLQSQRSLHVKFVSSHVLITRSCYVTPVGVNNTSEITGATSRLSGLYHTSCVMYTFFRYITGPPHL